MTISELKPFLKLEIKPSQFPIGHEEFWEVIAAEDTPAPLKDELMASIALLRHFDLIYRPGLTTERFVRVRILKLIHAVQDPSIRKVLADTLDCLWGEEREIVPEPIMRYGRSLEKRGLWPLARCVWGVVIEAWQDVLQSHSDGCIEARIGRAYANRRLGRLEDAIIDYVQANADASRARLPGRALQAIVGGAAAIADNGSPRLALKMLDDAVQVSKHLKRSDLEMWAHQTRGYIFQQGMQPDMALIEFSIAFEIAEKENNQDEVDLTLANISACAAEQGYWTLASDANELLIKTSHSNYALSIALCNLLELYTWQRDEASFYSTYDRIRKVSLDARVDATARLYYARGVTAFAATPGVLPISPSAEAIAEYSAAAVAIKKLGEETVYTTACAELSSLLNGSPVTKQVTEQALPEHLLLLHRVLLERLTNAAA